MLLRLCRCCAVICLLVGCSAASTKTIDLSLIDEATQSQLLQFVADSADIPSARARLEAEGFECSPVSVRHSMGGGTLPEGETLCTKYLQLGREHRGWQVGLITDRRGVLGGILIAPFRIQM